MKYEIKNQPFTVLTLHMSAGEMIKCQSGAMAWMSPGIRMETKTGGLGGMFKKALVGESLALNHFILHGTLLNSYILPMMSPITAPMMPLMLPLGVADTFCTFIKLEDPYLTITLAPYLQTLRGPLTQSENMTYCIL